MLKVMSETYKLPSYHISEVRQLKGWVSSYDGILKIVFALQAVKVGIFVHYDLTRTSWYPDARKCIRVNQILTNNIISFQTPSPKKLTLKGDPVWLSDEPLWITVPFTSTSSIDRLSLRFSGCVCEPVGWRCMTVLWSSSQVWVVWSSSGLYTGRCTNTNLLDNWPSTPSQRTDTCTITLLLAWFVSTCTSRSKMMYTDHSQIFPEPKGVGYIIYHLFRCNKLRW